MAFYSQSLLVHKDWQIMRTFIKKCLWVALLSLCSAPAYAATDSYRCLYDGGVDFGDRFDFSYDLSRNIILVQEHKDGGYRVDFTLGDVRQEGGMLQFEFEHWAQGTVAVREGHSLDLETMRLSSSKDFYSDDGSFEGHGPTATAQCEDEAEAPTLANEGKNDLSTKPNNQEQSISPNFERACHTETYKIGTLGQAGTGSGTWCVSSGLPSQKEYAHGPKNLTQLDGAWCEGEPDIGIGVSIEISLEPSEIEGTPNALNRLHIANGYDKTTQTYLENSRVKHIEIKTDDGQTWVRTLRDETGVQDVLLGGEISPNSILITILDVYPGQKYEDTCLSLLMPGFLN
jgi:hypothetical protein